MKPFYFIKKDFLGFPLDILKAYYDGEGDLAINNTGTQIPKTIFSLKKSKILHFESLEEILEYRICKCSKKTCEVNEELYKIVNKKMELKQK